MAELGLLQRLGQISPGCDGGFEIGEVLLQEFLEVLGHRSPHLERLGGDIFVELVTVRGAPQTGRSAVGIAATDPPAQLVEGRTPVVGNRSMSGPMYQVFIAVPAASMSRLAVAIGAWRSWLMVWAAPAARRSSSGVTEMLPLDIVVHSPW
ncbi:hypothetical protein IPZ61_03915 [Streptomyces sioyaensis]|uniref:hypothetical protein n=1 Tax=Streptomyces sioyaensis TaxID=67364 RepID=UPI001F2116A7|nr:hypothetical protein [Streptomyces sioyaensis]MCF3172474.1 hypothetical protein [Streptomyces sioyaensis]